MDLNIAENVCRLCANKGKQYHPIFDSKTNPIAEKINNCLPIEIREDDRLPSHICPGCLEALDISDKLRAQSLVADEILRQQLKVVLIDKIKQEKDVDTDDESQPMDTTERLFCGICEINFDGMTEFDDHMKASHSSQWICDLCHEDCKTSEDLLRHKYKDHYDSIDQNEEADIDLPKDDDVHHPPETTVDHSQEAEDSGGSGNTLGHYVDVKEFIKPKTEDQLSFQSSLVPSQPIERRNGVCSICKVPISTDNLMSLHAKLHRPLQIACSTCCLKFPTPYDLVTHKQSTHKVYVDQKMKWFCEKCEKFATSDQFLRRHKLCKKIQLMCKYCTQEFSLESELRFHQKKNHHDDVMKDPEPETMECETCGRIFEDKNNYKYHLRKHRETNHGAIPCSSCGKKFADARGLKCHVNVMHHGHWKYICDICFKSFPGPKKLEMHRRKHVNQMCLECSAAFENAETLGAHSLQQHSTSRSSAEKYFCNFCGSKFQELELLRDHEKFHARAQSPTIRYGVLVEEKSPS
ncbi:zinc finger protein 397 [Diachasma alloeum]|uniref:zinc finger protein 397 n=1 Tax=Diachasma alloeum TaxID=454923 RepID=UPI000738374E|nr:zinc finger protein 397 [Diachasma alloeum]